MLLRYSRRLPGVFLGFSIMAGIGYWYGMDLWAGPWLVGLALATAYRVRLGRAIERMPSDRQPEALPQLTRGFLISGLFTSPFAVMAFFTPTFIGSLAITVTMVCGCAISAATVAGSLRAFVGFSAPPLTILLAGLLIRGDTDGFYAFGGVLFSWVMFIASVRDNDRNLHELMGVVEDNARLSNAVELERDRANAASEAKTRFFAAASHDLRQPMNALSINATTLEILARRSGDAVLGEVSRGIGSALRQSTSLLDGILDISRLDAHAIEARFAPCEIGSLLSAVRDDHAPIAAQRGLSIDLRMPDESMWGWTDRDQFMRILGNLVSNAIKFTRVGGVTLSAHRGPGDCVLVRVIDTGIGIAQDQCERIFEEFYQIDNAWRDRSQGLGLGLAIVHRTAQLLGHTIRVDSKPGFGTLFELKIDAAIAVRDAQDDAQTSCKAASERRLAVLVVDDEAEGRAALSTYLRQLDWTVEGVTDVDGAASALDAGFMPDVVLVDYRLREETGLDVLARLRSRHPDLLAVIVTGETAPARFAELSGAAARVLHKPVNGELLASTLQAVVAQSEQSDAGA